MTPEHIDAVLPRVPAGIPALTGDLTDPDERAEAIDWLMSFYGAAEDSGGTATPSDTPAAPRNEHKAESGQHTLTAQTTIELPCSIPGCDGRCDPTTGAFNHRSYTFAVCVVDGAEPERLPDDYDVLGLPPAWLIEARDGTCPNSDGDYEACLDGIVYGPCEVPECGGLCESQGRCPDCIDGRPAVEVWQDKEVEDFDIWQVDNLTGRAVVFLGLGTVEHVLSVMQAFAPPNGIDSVRVSDQTCRLVLARQGYDLDITVTPGQYVALVKLEDA